MVGGIFSNSMFRSYVFLVAVLLNLNTSTELYLDKLWGIC